MSNRKAKRDAKRARPKTVRCKGCDNYHRQRVKKRGPLWAFCSHTCRKGFEVREALKKAARPKPTVKTAAKLVDVKFTIDSKDFEDSLGRISDTFKSRAPTLQDQIVQQMGDQIAKDLEAEILRPFLPASHGCRKLAR